MSDEHIQKYIASNERREEILIALQPADLQVVGEDDEPPLYAPQRVVLVYRLDRPGWRPDNSRIPDVYYYRYAGVRVL